MPETTLAPPESDQPVVAELEAAVRREVVVREVLPRREDLRAAARAVAAEQAAAEQIADQARVRRRDGERRRRKNRRKQNRKRAATEPHLSSSTAETALTLFRDQSAGQSPSRGTPFTRSRGYRALRVKRANEGADSLGGDCGLPRCLRRAARRRRADRAQPRERVAATSPRAAPRVCLALGFFAIVASARFALPAHRQLSIAAARRLHGLLRARVARAVRVRRRLRHPDAADLRRDVVPRAAADAAGRRLRFARCSPQLPDLVRRRTPVDRLALFVISSWFSVGPALVLFFWACARAALAARFRSTSRHSARSSSSTTSASFLMARRVVRASRRCAQLRSVLPAFAVDALLAPLGLLVAFAAYGRPWALLLVLPRAAALLDVRARAPAAHRQRARALDRVSRHGDAARRRHRGRRRVHGQSQP